MSSIDIVKAAPFSGLPAFVVLLAATVPSALLYTQVIENIKNIKRCRDSRTAKVKKQGKDNHIKQSSIQPPTGTIFHNMRIMKKDM